MTQKKGAFPMEFIWSIAGVAVALAAVFFVITYICYRMAFYQPPRKQEELEKIDIPKGRIYEPYREHIVNWIRQTRQMPCELMQITSFDGLKLQGKFYQYAPGAPVELMLHGYRGSSERDLAGGVQRCFLLGHSALVVEQRCSGHSEGKTITFGIREHRDCLQWVDCLIQQLGEDIKIILTGISMGAATVLMAAGRPLPKNVIGVLADCGYSSPRQIIRKVIRDMRLPVTPAYFFVRLGARLFGGFDLEEYSPIEAMQTCNVPVLLIHGENDKFVPCQMSRQLYDACQSKKRLVTVPNAGHGLSYLMARQQYLDALWDFFCDAEAYGTPKKRKNKI